VNKLRDRLSGQPAAHILDVGTGVGNFVAVLKEAGVAFAEIVGIDTSERAVDAARKNFADDPRIRFERMDALAMTYPDATFDVVCLSNTLHHLADPHAVFAAMRRVLKDDGILLVNEMTSDGLDERQISHRELHHLSAALDRAAGIVHRDTYEKDEILDVVARESGLAILASWTLAFPPAPEPTADEVESFAGTVDRLLARVADAGVRETFRERGEAVKAQIRTCGFAGATQLVVILGKASTTS